MSPSLRRLARSAAKLCAAVMPRDRRDWAEAMKAETEAIGDPRLALAYALGCVLACGKERMLDMDFIEKSARLAFPFLMLVFAAFPALASWRNSAVDPAAGLVFILLAAIMATAAIWSLWRGPVALIQAASSMLAVHLVAFFFMRSSPAVDARWINAALYEALALEGVFIWAALLAGGLWLAHRQRRAVSRSVG
jgi:heme/copper-type cytochrome/quinol oxidase subunit 4